MCGITEISFINAFLTLKPIKAFMDTKEPGFILAQISSVYS